MNLTLIYHRGWTDRIAHNLPNKIPILKPGGGSMRLWGTQKCPSWQRLRGLSEDCVGRAGLNTYVSAAFHFWLQYTWLITVENCTFTSVHAHTGTVQIWGWMSWSHFQFLHGCWRRCKEPWRLREKQTFDHISISTGFNYAGLLQVNKTCFPKAAKLSKHHIKFMSSHFIYKNKQITIQLTQKNIGGMHYSIPSCLSLMATLKRSSSRESSLIRSVMAFVNASC